MIDRNYEPELRSIPLTRFDCEERFPEDFDPGAEYCMITFFVEKCQDAIKNGHCPRGVQ